MEESIFHIDTLNIDNVSISYIEWRSHLIGKKPSILFLHATGFHSRLWDQIAAQLTDHHIIAPDLRGHGQSTKLSINHWSILSQDISVYDFSNDFIKTIYGELNKGISEKYIVNYLNKYLLRNFQLRHPYFKNNEIKIIKVEYDLSLLIDVDRVYKKIFFGELL